MTPFRPKPIPAGGTIGIAAPSSCFDPGLFKAGVDCLKSLGYRLVIPDEIYEKKRYLAGDDALRARILTELFEDPKIDGIICARGGYGAMRLLPFLDFERIAETPKPLVGFSDVGALLAAVHRRAGIVVYHGPTVCALASADDRTTAMFTKALSTAENLTIQAEEGIVLYDGTATAPVAGGNLTVLSHLLGTAYAPLFDGHILLLEDRGERPYRVDRMVSQMKLAGCFDSIEGLILGDFTDCGSPEEIGTIFIEALADRSIPMLAGFPVGHGSCNVTVPLGEIGCLDTRGRTLSFQRAKP